MLSLLSFGPLLVHGISHFGCIFFGCCYGYPYSRGIYNPFHKDLKFPTQPIEAMGAVAVVIYLFHRAKKKNYVPDGLEYPVMLTLFGSPRFLFEFLRDNEKLLFGCSNLAFHALFMFVVGVLWLVLLKKNSKRQQKAGETAI
jgi:prolipoprotein diacylglyceryltransferase